MFETYHCPYCNLAGWRKNKDFEAHLKKSHGKKINAKEAKKIFYESRIKPNSDHK